MKATGDEKASSLFEFLASNSNVEWSQTMLGASGKNGINYLTTSHEKAGEQGFPQLFTNSLYKGYTIREHVHSHPSNAPYPSGLNDGTADIGFAKAISNWYDKKYPDRTAPIFRIYTPKDGKYIDYNKNSKRSDFR